MHIMHIVLRIVFPANMRAVHRVLLVTGMVLLSISVGCKPQQHGDWMNLISQARRSMAIGEYGKADATFTRAIRECPDDALLVYAYGGRADLNLHQGLLDAAIQDYSKALWIDSELTSQIYECRGGAYEQKGLDKQAIDDYTKAISLARQHRSIPYVRRAKLLMGAGNTQAALDDLNIVLQRAGADRLQGHEAKYLAHCYRGKIYAEKGQRDRAIEDLSEAIRLKPDQPFSYGQRGDIYAQISDHSGKSEQTEEVLADYTSYIDLRPTKSFGYSRRGRVLGVLGRHEEALHDFDKALEIDPNWVDAHLGRAHVYQKQGKYEMALEEIDHVLSNRSYAYESFAYYMRGCIYACQGKYDMAVKEYDRGLAIEPDSVSTLNSRGFALEALGLHKKAIRDFAKARSLAPDDPKLHFYLAWTRYNMGQFGLAYEGFRKAIDVANDQDGSTPVPYAHFHAVLSGRRANSHDSMIFAELPASAIAEEERDWVGKLQGFFARRITVDALLDAAESEEDEQKRKRYVCEAYFYAATRQILNGDIPRARSLLERSVAANAFDCYEHVSAIHELQRIEQDARDSEM